MKDSQREAWLPPVDRLALLCEMLSVLEVIVQSICSDASELNAVWKFMVNFRSTLTPLNFGSHVNGILAFLSTLETHCLWERDRQVQHKQCNIKD